MTPLRNVCLFLFMAVAVADDATCAASSPGCASNMQADANTLLQTGVRIGDELANGRTDEEEKNTYTGEATSPHKVSWMQEGLNTQQLKEKLIDSSKGKGRQDVLMQLSRFVNTLGNATKHLNSSNADNLNGVIKILRAVMYKSMDTDHTEDQNELNQAFAGITMCNTDLGKATADTVTPLKSTMEAARITHTTCRTEEALLETIKVGKWNNVVAHIADISIPPSVTTWPVAPTYDDLVPYFSTGYTEWFVTQKQAFDTKKNAYVSANTNWTTRKDRCDRDQTMFESNFCVYNSELDTMCLNHDTCYTSANSGATTTTARVKGTEAARKDAYKAGEEIVCRINALLANRAYSDCDDLAVNTSNYSIVYPIPDAKDSCVSEADEPCSTTWVDTEFKGLPSNAPSTTCTPCQQAPSTAPTVAPTTKPSQATTTAKPTTQVPTTAEPTTSPEATTTAKPKTQVPTTTEPTTSPEATTTAKPTTQVPTTAEPTTLPEATTTATPTTQAPTTAEPTTSPEATTTAQPTTQAPTTAEPTTSPEAASNYDCDGQAIRLNDVYDFSRPFQLSFKVNTASAQQGDGGVIEVRSCNGSSCNGSDARVELQWTGNGYRLQLCEPGSWSDCFVKGDIELAVKDESYSVRIEWDGNIAKWSINGATKGQWTASTGFGSDTPNVCYTGSGAIGGWKGTIRDLMFEQEA